MSNLDLSKNVIYDMVLLGKIHQEKKPPSNDYPNDEKVYDIISEYYKIDKKNIAIGLGSGEVLSRVISNLKLSELYVIEPTFHGAERFCRNSGIMYIPIYYKDFNEIDIEDIPVNTYIYLANPNGNNGHSFRKEDIQYLIDNNKLVIIDEAYVDYGGDSFIYERRDNVVVLRTFSKSLGLPWLRCGFAVSTARNISDIRSTELPYCSTHNADYILENNITEIPATVERMLKTKSYVEALFDHAPSSGCYVLLDKKYENLFKGKCKYAYRGDYLRISLTNESFFRYIWEESQKKN